MPNIPPRNLEAARKPRQLTEIYEGQRLQAIRSFKDHAKATIQRGKKMDVITLMPGGWYAVVAFHQPIRLVTGGGVLLLTFSHKGFPNCLLVTRQELLNNCKDILYATKVTSNKGKGEDNL